MNYHLRSREESKSYIRTSILISLIIAVFLLFIGSVFRGASTSILLTVGTPLWNGSNFISNFLKGKMLADTPISICSDYYSETSFPAGTSSKKNGVTASSSLSSFSSSSAKTLVSEDENYLRKRVATLERLLDIYDEKKVLVAGVLQTPPTSVNDTLIIDAGRNENIKIGAKVYYRDEYLIGKVAEVYADNSMVRLFSTNGEKSDIRINNGSSTLSYEAEGRGGGEFSIKVPRDIKVSAGDTVFFPGADTDLLGKVAYVQENYAKVFKDVMVRFPFSFSSLDYVAVEKN